MMPAPQLPGLTGFHTDNLTADLDRKNPKAIAGQFEALFYRIMFEQMRSEDEDPLMEGSDGQQIQAMFHDELANVLGQQESLGIAKLINQEMERHSQPGLVK